MIPVPNGAQVWLATGHTDMRRGFDGLALMVQEELRRDPHGGDLFVFRGRRGGLIKILWHDGRGCACFRSGWNVAASSGRRLAMVWSRSRRPSLAICSKASTGGCRSTRGVPKPPDKCAMPDRIIGTILKQSWRPRSSS